MINVHERMLLTSAGVESATSWSPVGRRIQLSHQGLFRPHHEQQLLIRHFFATKIVLIILRHENHNKGMKHSWKKFPPPMGFAPGLSVWKSIVLTTEPNSGLPDAVVRDWIYTYKLCEICQGRLFKAGVPGHNIPPFQGIIHYDAKPFSVK